MSGEAAHRRLDRLRSAARSGGRWAGYGWFMSFGTVVPLVVFLGGYLVQITFVGAPLARRVYRIGIWSSTLGMEPPGKEKIDARKGQSTKKPLFERIRPYSPPGMIERRGRPAPMPVRVIWFLLVGWWLGALWLLLSWSVFLLPYPLPEAVETLLTELPSVMTLAWPATAGPLPTPAPA
jgi:uncharacterized membrane protein YccF (DUF307 family)